jgi:hypothetical protein
MIGGTLEYLMSSLPNLSFQDTAEAKEQVLSLLHKYEGNAAEASKPIEILESEAQKYLPASKFAAFQKLRLNNIHAEEFRHHKSKVLAAFSTFNFELKDAIRKWRITQKDEKNKAVNRKVEQLIGEGTPLEKEIRIMKHQWDKLEELSIGHFADFDALAIYKMKLMILLRWWSFNAEKGMAHFTQLTSNN